MTLMELALILLLVANVPIVTTSFALKSWKRPANPCYPAKYATLDRTRDVMENVAVAFMSKKSSFDDSVYGSFEEGRFKVTRNDDQNQFSLYYRIYHKEKQDSKAPLVILHGGP